MMFVFENVGAYIPHGRIMFCAQQLYRPGGMHLSDLGCDIFLIWVGFLRICKELCLSTCVFVGGGEQAHLPRQFDLVTLVESD